MIEETFEEIGDVGGVLGCFVCDNQGRVIFSSFPADLEGNVLRDAAHEVTQTLATLAKASGEVTALDVACDHARLVARDLGRGALVVLCEPDVEIAMLRLTLNVGVAQLREDAELQGELEGRGDRREVLESDLDEVSWQLLRALERKEADNA